MTGHIEMKYATPILGPDQKHVKDLETQDGTVKKSMEISCWA